MSELNGSGGVHEAPAEEEVVEKRFNQNGITQVFVCQLCFLEKPRGVSSGGFSRLHVGFTSRGMQVWCARHDVNVIHFDFEGKTLRGSDRIDEEDRSATLALAPKRAKVVEENGLDVIRAGLAVIHQRIAAVGYRGEAHPKGATYGELLASYNSELERYLSTGELTAEWAQALQMMRIAKGQGIILPSVK